MDTNLAQKLKVTIKPMQKSDLDDIMQIESTVYSEHHWNKESFESEIVTDLGNYFSLFEVNSNKLIGYGGFWNILDEGHITTLAIAKEYQGKGLSELLLQKFIEIGYLKSIKWFTLEVRISNITAFKLYTKYLFQSLGVRPKYYQDTKEDALIMWTENIHNDKFKITYEKLKKISCEKIDLI